MIKCADIIKFRRKLIDIMKETNNKRDEKFSNYYVILDDYLTKQLTKNHTTYKEFHRIKFSSFSGIDNYGNSWVQNPNIFKEGCEKLLLFFDKIINDNKSIYCLWKK